MSIRVRPERRTYSETETDDGNPRLVSLEQYRAEITADVYVYETPTPWSPSWKDPDAIIVPAVVLSEPSVLDDAPRSVPEMLRDLEDLAREVPALRGLKPEWQPSMRVPGYEDNSPEAKAIREANSGKFVEVPLMTGELLGFRVPPERSGRPRGSGHPGGDLLVVRIKARTSAEARRVVEECAAALDRMVPAARPAADEDP
jgi:hypothetical protein